MEKKNQFNFWYAAIAIALIFLFQSLWLNWRTVEQIPYSQFEKLLKEGQIEEVVVRETTLQGKLRMPIGGREYFITRRVDPDFAKELTERNIKFTGGTEQTLLRDILSWTVPILFFFGLWMFVFRKMAEKQGLGGLMSVGKSDRKSVV